MIIIEERSKTEACNRQQRFQHNGRRGALGITLQNPHCRAREHGSQSLLYLRWVCDYSSSRRAAFENSLSKLFLDILWGTRNGLPLVGKCLVNGNVLLWSHLMVCKNNKVFCL